MKKGCYELHWKFVCLCSIDKRPGLYKNSTEEDKNQEKLQDQHFRQHSWKQKRLMNMADWKDWLEM